MLQRVQAEVGEPRDVAARARGCRRRRTSGDLPELDDVVPRDLGAGRDGDDDAPALDDVARRPAAPDQSAASRSASATPPSETSCASEKRCAFSPDEAHEPVPVAAEQDDAVAALPARGCASRRATSPTQPTTGVGGIGAPPVSL